jgi:hypothetical protein
MHFYTNQKGVNMYDCKVILEPQKHKTNKWQFHLHRSKPPFKPLNQFENTEVKYITEVKFLEMRITENLS